MSKTPFPVSLQKPNALIAMRPISGRMTVNGRKGWNSILLHTHYALNEQYGAGQDPDGYFEAPLRVLLTAAGLDPNSGKTVDDFKRYFEEMQSIQVDWLSLSRADTFAPAPQPSEQAGGEVVLADTSALLYRSKIISRDGMLWAKWLLPEEIVRSLRGVNDILWTRLQLTIISKLGTYAAVILYEICSRYKSHATGLTARQPVDFWIDVLNRHPGASERREYRKFKSEQLKPAIEEINSLTDIEIELIEHKLGRKIVEIQFKIRRRAPTEMPVGSFPTIDSDILAAAQELGIDGEATVSLARQYSQERVRQKLSLLKVRLADPVGFPQPASPAAYLKMLLLGRDEPSQLLAETGAEVPDSPAHVEPTRLPPVSLPALDAASVAKLISDLPEAEYTALVGRAMAAFVNTPSCSRLMRVRIEQRRFEHPQLQAAIRDRYVKELSATSWKQEGLFPSAPG